MTGFYNRSFIAYRMTKRTKKKTIKGIPNDIVEYLVQFIRNVTYLF